MISLFNENCFDTMADMSEKCIDVILTSPFYNTNKKQGNKRTLLNSKHDGCIRYDVHIDNMSDEEYNDFTEELFNKFDRILKTNGVILYNISYGNNNRDGMFKAINAIITKTPFTIGDVIIWKKSSALPNNCSPNKLTRIIEFVFVFCRKTEVNSYHCNKPISSIRRTGQKSYSNIFNFIEAKNNDGVCPFNKATYSSELCEKLLNIYAPAGGTVYDPFIGSGTTAVACKRLGLNCYGSEISENQIRFSLNRLVREFGDLEDTYCTLNGNIMDLSS